MNNNYHTNHFSPQANRAIKLLKTYRVAFMMLVALGIGFLTETDVVLTELPWAWVWPMGRAFNLTNYRLFGSALDSDSGLLSVSVLSYTYAAHRAWARVLSIFLKV